MNRPWQVWLAFAFCATVVLAAMSWLTMHAVQADLNRGFARAQADLEQRVSLVLWRMDTKLAPLIAEEVARPPSFYRATAAPNLFAEQQGTLPVVSAPNTRKNVLLNFDVGIDGTWRSPQAPDVAMTESKASANRGEQFADSRHRLR